MADYFFIVEGQTEERFYKSILSKKFSSRHNFYVVVMPHNKNAFLRSEKGGVIAYDVTVKNVKRFLNQATHCDIVFLIYDYYGIHQSFKDHLTPADNTLDKKIASIQKKLEDEINNRRFKFILQVHEFESYLFSNVNEIANHFDSSTLPDLSAILSSFSNNPELINDSRETAPSKRLFKLYPEFTKTIDGISIAEKIGIDTIRSRCQYFNSFCQLFD